MIKEFRGIYSFLSNFFSSPIYHDGILYPTVEHFYQAMKTLVRWERVQISLAKSPAIAKRMASRNGYMTPTGLFKITLRPDWEDIKIIVMMDGLRAKFKHPELGKKLVATYPQQLVEGNWHHDKIWGVDLRTGVGQNLLGKCLGEVRLELINKREA